MKVTVWTLLIDDLGSGADVTVHPTEAAAYESLRVNYFEDDSDAFLADMDLACRRTGIEATITSHEVEVPDGPMLKAVVLREDWIGNENLTEAQVTALNALSDTEIETALDRCKKDYWWQAFDGPQRRHQPAHA